MKQSNLRSQRPKTTRRIAGHAQEDPILDPHQRQQKLHDNTVCPQCRAVYRDRRGRWTMEPKVPRRSCAAGVRYGAAALHRIGEDKIATEDQIEQAIRHRLADVLQCEVDVLVKFGREAQRARSGEGRPIHSCGRSFSEPAS